MAKLNRVTVLAPAKLNLALDVVGTLPNGYHDLDMTMQAITLYEKVVLTRSNGLNLTLPGSPVAANDSNTAIKAAIAFFRYTGLLAGVALQYERQISALNQNYAAIQSSYAAQQAELSAQISELQDAVRMGEATVLDWRWLPVDKLHRDADKSWMPVQVQVTPRTTRDGATARLAVRCGDDTQLYEMTAAPDGSFAADGIVFTVGSTYELSVQWTADGVTTNETLGTVDFNDEMTEPQIIWGAVGSSLDFGYSVRRVGNKQYRLTLTCYPVEVQVDAPPWMQPAQVEIDLRLNGDAGEPTATAVLDCEGESSYGNSSRTESVWNGTFYSEDAANGWEYDGETLPKYVVRVTDTNGNVWTEEMPLSKR